MVSKTSLRFFTTMIELIYFSIEYSSFFLGIWTVFNDGNNQVHLYNYNNFLGIVDGETKVIHVVSGPFDLILSTFLKV